MEGPEVVVTQVHQVLQGGVKLLHDALNPRARDAGHGGRKKDRWTDIPSQNPSSLLQRPQRHLLGASPKPGVPHSQLMSHTCPSEACSLLTQLVLLTSLGLTD